VQGYSLTVAWKLKETRKQIMAECRGVFNKKHGGTCSKH